jgi:predicted transglutaminase-like protease
MLMLFVILTRTNKNNVEVYLAKYLVKIEINHKDRADHHPFFLAIFQKPDGTMVRSASL